MKSVLVLGGTGRCGQAVVQRAFELEMQVRVFVRNEEKARKMFGNEKGGGVDIIKGELEDVEKMTNALQGVDGVVSTIASFNPPHTQMSTAMNSLAQAARKKMDSTKSINDDDNKQKLQVFHYGVCGFHNPSQDFKFRQSLASIVSPWKFGPAIQDHRRTLELLEENQLVLQTTIFQTPTIDYSKPLGDEYISGSPQDAPGMKIWNKVGAMDAADACLQRLGKESPKILNLIYT